MANDNEVETARRRYESAAAKVGKVPYLNGNGNEAEYARSYENYAHINNATPGRPHVMLPKRKLRQ